MSVFDQLLEDIEADHEEWEERGRELAAKRLKVKAIGDRALDAHEARYDAAATAFQKLEDTAKRLQGNEPPPQKAPKTVASGATGLPGSEKQTVTADEVGDAGKVIGAAPDWPPQRSAIGEIENSLSRGSTGQLFRAMKGQWVRVPEEEAAGEFIETEAPAQGGTFQKA